MKRRILNIIITGLIIVISFVLQSYISLKNGQSIVAPNLLLMVTSIFGFIKGSNYGSLTGLFSGLLVDIFFGEVIGLFALVYMYIGFISGIFKKILYSDLILMPMLVTFINDFLYNGAYYVFRFLLRNKLDFSYYFMKIILPEMIFTTFLTFVFYKLFCLLDEKILTEKQENRFSFDK